MFRLDVFWWLRIKNLSDKLMQIARDCGSKTDEQGNHRVPPTKDTFLNKAEVIDMSGFYSANAGQDMILNNLFDLRGKKSKKRAKVFINQGDAASKDALEEVIRKRAQLKVPGERAVRDICIADSRWLDLK